MRVGLCRVGLALALAAWAGAFASAQEKGPAAVTGVVRDSDSHPLAGAAVVVRNNAGGIPARAVTDSTGAFSVGLAPDRHLQRDGVLPRLRDVGRQGRQARG